MFLSPDYQFINHPVFNRDRGPVPVFRDSVSLGDLICVGQMKGLKHRTPEHFEGARRHSRPRLVEDACLKMTLANEIEKATCQT